MIKRPIEILLVEDSAADAWLIRECLKQGSIPKNINVVNNGEEAMSFLRRRGAYEKAPRPDLVLLDLNLPRRDGLEVLRDIKSDVALRTITVIVLTTSDAAIDINAAYDLNANCYVVKPVDLDEFTFTIRGIEDFWMRLASLPSFTPHLLSPERECSEKGASADGGPNPKRRPSTYLWYSRRSHRVLRGRRTHKRFHTVVHRNRPDRAC